MNRVIPVSTLSRLTAAQVADELEKFGPNELRVKVQNGEKVLYARPRPSGIQWLGQNLFSGRLQKRQAANDVLRSRLAHMTDPAVLKHLRSSNATRQAKAFLELASRPLPTFSEAVLTDPEYHGTRGEFHHFLRQQLAAENLEFLVKVDALSNLDGRKLKVHLAETMRQMTLPDDHPDSVNLKGDSRLKVAGTILGLDQKDGKYVISQEKLTEILKAQLPPELSGTDPMPLTLDVLSLVDWNKGVGKCKLDKSELVSLFGNAGLRSDLINSLRDTYRLFAQAWQQGQKTAPGA